MFFKRINGFLPSSSTPEVHLLCTSEGGEVLALPRMSSRNEL